MPNGKCSVGSFSGFSCPTVCLHRVPKARGWRLARAWFGCVFVLCRVVFLFCSSRFFQMQVANSEDLAFAGYIAQLGAANYDNAGDIIVTCNDVRGRNGNMHKHVHNACRTLAPIAASLVTRMLTGQGWTVGQNPHARDYVPPVGAPAAGGLVGNYINLGLNAQDKNVLCDSVRQTISQERLGTFLSLLSFFMTNWCLLGAHLDLIGSVIVTHNGASHVFKIRLLLVPAPGGQFLSNMVIQMKRYNHDVHINPVVNVAALLAALHFN